MQCKACNKSFPHYLSVCPSCGTVQIQNKGMKESSVLPNAVGKEFAAAGANSPNSTLLEFPGTRGSDALPDWRRELKARVRAHQNRQLQQSPTKSLDSKKAIAEKIAKKKTGQKQIGLVTSLEKTPDERVVNALKRIEESRLKNFQIQTEPAKIPSNVVELKVVAPEKPQTVIKPEPNRLPNRVWTNVPDESLKPISPPTNIVPPISENVSPPKKSLLENPGEIRVIELPVETFQIQSQNKIIKHEPIAKEKKILLSENELLALAEPKLTNPAETDDIPHFSTRFISALIDSVIGLVGSFILLIPFGISNAWINFQGLFAFLAVYSLVMFLYLTTFLAWNGSTIGMGFYRLKAIDVEYDEKPTLNQAAISSSCYLLSLGFLGIGFLTALLDAENRTIYDIVSGTVIIQRD